MEAIQQAVIEWLQNERQPPKRHQVVTELYYCARNNKLWPAMTMEQIETAINALVKAEKLIDKNGTLRLVSDQPKNESKEPEQLELF